MEKVIKISYSQMSTFNECPHKWYRRYVMEDKRAEYPALQFGKAVHKQIENTLLRKLKSISIDDIPYIKDKSKSEIEEEINFACQLAGKAVNGLITVKDFGIYDLLNTKFTCEEEFNIDIGNGIFRGFIDLSFKNALNEIILIDWKTTSNPYSEHDIKTSKQLTCYAYAYYRLYGEIPNKLCYVTLNKKTDQVFLYYDTRTLDDLKEIELQLQNTIEMIKTGIKYKDETGCFTGPQNSWKCQFYNDCWRTTPVIIDVEQRQVKFARPN